MSVFENRFAVIDVKSGKGIDGSNSRVDIPDGYCEELENADITTAGIIRKRRGYVQIGQRVPTTIFASRYVGIGTVNRWEVNDPQIVDGDEYFGVLVYPNTSGQTLIQSTLGTQPELLIGSFSSFLVLDFLHDVGLVDGEQISIFNNPLGAYGGVTYRFVPVATYGGRFAVIHTNTWNDLALILQTTLSPSPGAVVTEGLRVTSGVKFPMVSWNEISYVERIQLNPVSVYRVHLHSESSVPPEQSKALLHYRPGTVTASNYQGKYFDVTLTASVDQLHTASLPQVFYSIAPYDLVGGTALDGATVSPSSTIETHQMLVLGSITSGGSFSSPAVAGDQLFVISGGKMFFPGVYGSVYTPSLDTLSTYTGANNLVATNDGRGYFTLNYAISIATAGSLFQVTYTDTSRRTIEEWWEPVTTTRFYRNPVTYAYPFQQSGGTLNQLVLPSTYHIRIKKKTVNLPYTGATPDPLTNFILTAPGGGNIVRTFYPPSGFRDYGADTELLDSATGSYPDFSWSVVSTYPVENNTSISSAFPTRNNAYSVPLAAQPFNQSLVVSNYDGGTMRCDGVALHPMHMFKPMVEAIRSVPNSKGNFGVEKGRNNQKVGKNISCAFTYSFLDSFGRKIESEPSEIINFSPNACNDGSDYSELAEYRITGLPWNCFFPLNNMRLNAYVTYTDSVAEYKYKLYSSVPVKESGIQTITLGSTNTDLIFADDENRPYLNFAVTGTRTIPAPNAKFLTSVAGRLIALNTKTYGYMKLNGLRVFDSENNYDCPIGISVNRYDVSLDVPLKDLFYPCTAKHIVSASGEPEIQGGTYFRYQDLDVGYPTITTNVVGSIGYFYQSTGNITLSYLDTSHKFRLEFSGSVASSAPRAKLRTTGTQNVDDLDIDFKGAVFSYDDTIAAPNQNMTAPTKWRDTNLNAFGTPNSVANTRFVLFGGATNVTATSQAVSALDAFIVIASGKDGTVAVEYWWKTTNTAYALPAPTAQKYLVIQGPGTLGNLKDAGDSSKILRWESDLTWKISGAVQSRKLGAGDVAYSAYALTPLKLVQNAVTFVAEPCVLKGEMASAQTAQTTPYSMEVFIAQSESFDGNVSSAVTKFSTPSTGISITGAGFGPASIAVGEYVLVDVGESYLSAVRDDFPQITGAKKVTAIGAGSITIEVLPTEALFRPAAATTLVLTNTGAGDNINRIVNLTKTFVDQGNGSVRINALHSLGTKTDLDVFLMTRGTGLQDSFYPLCGWFQMDSGTDTNQFLLVKKALPTLGGSFDVSKISGLKSSFYLYSLSSDPLHFSRLIPVPVPAKAGLPETGLDAAISIFTANLGATGTPYVQVTKRFAMAMAQVMRDRFFPSFVSQNGLGVLLEPNEVMFINANRLYGNQYNFAPIKIPAEITFWEIPSSATYVPGVCTLGGYFPSTARIESDISPSRDLGMTNVRVQYREDSYGTRFHWTDVQTDTQASTLVQTFREGFRKDLDTEDDTDIQGAVPFQNTLLVFKENSIWRVTFRDDNSVETQRVQSTVGSYSHYNLPATLDKAYFVHTTGVYSTDGNTADHIFKLNRFFDEKVIKNKDLLRMTAGHVDHDKKKLQIGVPYLSSYSDRVSEVDGQFAYSYNDGVLGWSVNTHIDALKYFMHNNGEYFLSDRGLVCRMRDEGTLEDYRDLDDPIPFVLKTRYTNSNESARFKFYRNVLFKLGYDTKDNFSVWYLRDYKEIPIALDTYPMENYRMEGNVQVYGNGKFLKTLRETLAQRVDSMSFLLTENSRNTDASIYAIQVEGMLLNSRLFSQKNSPGNLANAKGART